MKNLLENSREPAERQHFLFFSLFAQGKLHFNAHIYTFTDLMISNAANGIRKKKLMSEQKNLHGLNQTLLILFHKNKI